MKECDSLYVIMYSGRIFQALLNNILVMDAYKYDKMKSTIYFDECNH